MLKAVLTVIIAILLSSIIKTIIELYQGRTWRWDRLGGMPSTHCAGVTSLFFVVYFESGLSLLLLVCGVFAWIVIRDAYGVRWEVTRHSVALNKILKTAEFDRTGHKITEVMAGVLLGLLIPVVSYLIL
jgi:acid phosphatase family membrane protein YuiD